MKKIVTLVCLLLLAACSKQSEDAAGDSSAINTGEQVELAQKSTGQYYSGFWANCYDKKATKQSVEENCDKLDQYLWAFNAEEVIIYGVTSAKASFDCTAPCFSAKEQSVSTKYVARGELIQSKEKLTVTFVDSNDEKNFPLCTMHWLQMDEVNEELKRWEFQDGDCGMESVIFTPWVAKYNGQVNTQG